MSAQDFVLELGRAMHALGTAAYRVEDTMDACCRRFGLRGSFFATPTAIFAAIGPEGGKAETVLLRVRPGTNDLGKLADLYSVRDEVVQRGLAASEGRARIAAILAAPPTQPQWLHLIAWPIGSACAAVFLGGGTIECAASAAIGLLVAVFGALVERRRHLGSVFVPSACALAAFALSAVASRTDLDLATAIVASIVPLLPGLSFTTALAELSMQHLASGSARLLGALAALVTMAVGIGLGGAVGAAAFGPAIVHSPQPVWGWALWPALLAVTPAYSVLLRAKWRQVPWVFLAILACYSGGKLGDLWLDRALSPFCGALAVALAANLYSHLQRKPAAVLRTPGLLLLVPGSLGLRGLSLALQGGVTAGSEFAFRMVLVAGSIVAGLLVASALLPPPLDVEPSSERLPRGPAPPG